MMRDLATIEECIRKPSDFDGDTVEIWREKQIVAVEYPKRGTTLAQVDVVDQRQMAARNQRLARIRWPGFEVTTKMRIRFTPEHVENIAAVTNVENKNQLVELLLVKPESQ